MLPIAVAFKLHARSVQAEEVLELARYANMEAQKPLAEDELIFTAKYPKIAKKLLTLISPEKFMLDINVDSIDNIGN
jgi:hypothetical protein